MNRLFERLDTLWRSFAVKLLLLVAALAAVPIILFVLFRAADAEKNALLQRSIYQEGHLIAALLRPEFSSFQTNGAGALSKKLAELGEEVNIKILFRPTAESEPESFFYIATNADTSANFLEQDRQELLAKGILNSLPDTCVGDEPLAVRYTNPVGAEEVLTSLTPVKLHNGCWVIVTSRSGDMFLKSSFGQPYWATTEAQLSAVVYILLVVLVIFLFVEGRNNVRRFGEAARALRDSQVTNPSFRLRNRIPELDWLAEEFDRLVQALDQSATNIRQAAHENAHALKAPLAVISQSIEPLKRNIADDNTDAHRAIERIEHSIQRLETTVSIARFIDQTTAELLDPPRELVDLSALFKGVVESYRSVTAQKNLQLADDIEDGIVVRGSEELLETVIENLLENAVSFAPLNSSVSARLTRQNDGAEIVVADEGPGVPKSDLTRIFERYFSQREDSDNDHFNLGLGLWIVRRNVEAIGGTVIAENGEARGFVVTVSLPAPSSH